MLSLLQGRQHLSDAIVQAGIEREQILVLPGEQTNASSEWMASPAMATLLDTIKREFRSRIIILDLPPVLSIVDVRTISRWVDSFIMVIDWQHTSRDAVVDAVQSAPDVEQKLIGSVLNKAMIRSLKSYGEHVDAYYVGSYFRG